MLGEWGRQGVKGVPVDWNKTGQKTSERSANDEIYE